MELSVWPSGENASEVTDQADFRRRSSAPDFKSQRNGDGFPANHANDAKLKEVAEPEQLPKKGSAFGLRSFSEVVLLSRR